MNPLPADGNAAMDTWNEGGKRGAPISLGLWGVGAPHTFEERSKPMTEALFTLHRITDEVEADPTNTFSKAGAERLKERIEAYWRARGREVFVRITPSGFHRAIRSARYDLRSDLIDGLPRKTSQAIKREAA